MKFIIDLDGTLLNNMSLNKDGDDFISYLKERSYDFLIMTNSIQSPVNIRKRLEKVGISVSTNQILNPIVAINETIKKHNYKKALIVGSQEEINQVDIDQNLIDPDVVILLDFEKNNVAYQTLQTLVDFMEKDIPVLTASKSFYYLKDGKKQVDTGAFVALLEKVTSKSIKVMGKPSDHYFHAGIHKLGGKPEAIIIIGDDYQTDILGAKKVASKAVLIRSGKFHRDDEILSNHDLCVNNFKEIIEAIEKGGLYV